MSRAAGSACGRPPGAVTARPTTRPSFTTTQPTDGLGQVLPTPRRASARAAHICAASSACEGRDSSAMTGLRGLAKRADEVLEILGLAEIAIDAGKADVGDRIELPQRVHHQFTDLLRRNVALATGPE